MKPELQPRLHMTALDKNYAGVKNPPPGNVRNNLRTPVFRLPKNNLAN
jgi:hypothetical protein